MTFEKALKALETLVEQMEDGELSLEDAVRCYERGVALHQHCQRALDTAEQKVRILTERGDGAERAPFTQEGEDQL
ncbi:MAG: exodeoxyribonuclease VII small subunit [Gammaproteobacteria bacterium]|nr:exodeoxyribonuclease VII small subunit [Gammaproteobacteria bacterium]